jgi:NAD(P)-dependent dehydrogenase (short-subunit alcohol dehydrogenase family)
MESINIFSDLRDKVALVTGGYGYLGHQMAITLQKHGAKVFVAGRNEKKFREQFSFNDEINFITIDISKSQSIKNAFSEVVSSNGQIDILINNAVYGVTNNPEKMTNDEWVKGIDGGLNSVFRTIKEVIPFMKRNGGKIVNISSMYGVVVPDLKVYEGREEFLNPPNYGTAKAGVLHLTKYYAMYLAKYGINVNAISPGPFPSKEVQKDKIFIDRLISKVPLKRIGTPEDLSGVILLLSSAASNYITGQNICVDGGWTIS